MITMTMEFHREYEAERTVWLRRRFLWYAGVVGCSWLIAAMARIVQLLLMPRDSFGLGSLALLFCFDFVKAILFLSFFVHARRRSLTQERVLWLVFWLVVIGGAIIMITSPWTARIGAELKGQPFNSLSAAETSLVAALGTHVLASLFIPWTVREAARPILPLVLVFAVMTLIFGGPELSVGEILLLVGLSPLIGVPGVLIAWFRHSRFRDRFHYQMLSGRYREMRQELIDARRVHESLFPRRIGTGPLRLDYQYQPMRQIGGDYLFASVEPADSSSPHRLSVVLLDVTGHGVAAALTVNRIHGELERLFAESPDISPGRTLAALNHYISLTLAKHNIYATALCLRADVAQDTVQWASAGHPPAFLRTAAGRIDRLDSTSIVLGATRDEEFDPSQEEIRFGDGDALILYTDGATEARDQGGVMFGINGVQRVVASRSVRGASGEGEWAHVILRAVNEHRHRAPEDDTLVVEIRRPV